MAYAPNRYRRVQMNTATLNYAPTNGCACSSLKGVPLYCIIFRTATDPEDITGGYLVELDNLYYGYEPSRFTVADMDRYVVKSPEYGSRAQMTYIATLMAEAQQAVMSKDRYNNLGRHYSEYIDIESLARAYVLAEITKNCDGFYSSMFFCKDADGTTAKIYAEPVWDYDNTLGKIDSGEFSTRLDDLWNAEPSDGRQKTWPEYLMKHPEFRLAAAKVYSEATKEVFEMLSDGGYTDTLVKTLGGSAANDWMRWEKGFNNDWPLNYDGSHTGYGFFRFLDTYTDGKDKTADTTIGYLKNFFYRRADVLGKTVGTYAIDTDIYYPIGICPELADSVDLSCEFVMSGKRASFRVSGGIATLLKLNIKDADGNIIEIEESETTSGYDDGIYAFTMPESAVYITAVGSSPASPVISSYKSMDYPDLPGYEEPEQTTEATTTEETSSEEATAEETIVDENTEVMTAEKHNLCSRYKRGYHIGSGNAVGYNLG